MPSAFLGARAADAAPFGVLLAADVVWLEELAALLASALAAVCRTSPAAEVLIVHQLRSESTKDSFLAAMAAESFTIAWELLGGRSGVEPRSVGGVTWHPDFVPNERFSLWAFRFAGSGQCQIGVAGNDK